MQCDPYDWIKPAINTIRRASWYRSVQAIEGKRGAVVQLAGKEVINFASNDYLGLAGDDRLIQSAISATTKFGTGSTGSRLLSGHRDLHRELENAIAFTQTPEEQELENKLAELAALETVKRIKN